MLKKVLIVGLMGLLVVGGAFGAMVLAGNRAYGTVSVEAMAAEPADVVASFYGWYLDHAGYDAESGTMRNPLVDGSYAAREELSPALVDEVDALLASFREGGAGYDPLLCAQDIPTEFSVNTSSISESVAEVRVETSFVGHSFLVMLEKTGSEWTITAVRCSFE